MSTSTTWAITFPYQAGTQGSPNGQGYFENGATFPVTVTTIAKQASDVAYSVGQSGPWHNGTDRYLILQSNTDTSTARRLFAYHSTDGSTWAEVDAAHAPSSLPKDDASNSVYYYIYGCDTSGTNIHIVYFNTSSFLTYVPFDMAASTWGTAVPSTLSYQSTNATQEFTDDGLGVVYRSTDTNLIVTLPDGDVNGNLWQYYTRYSIASSTWSTTWTPLADHGTDTALTTLWLMNGLVEDINSNVHFFFNKEYFNSSNTATSLFDITHQVLHTDNSLSALDTVFQGNAVNTVTDSFYNVGGTITATEVHYGYNVAFSFAKPFAGSATVAGTASTELFIPYLLHTYTSITTRTDTGTASDVIYIYNYPDDSVWLASGLATDAVSWGTGTPISTSTVTRGHHFYWMQMLQTNTLTYGFIIDQFHPNIGFSTNTTTFIYTTNTGAGWAVPTAIGTLVNYSNWKEIDFTFFQFWANWIVTTGAPVVAFTAFFIPQYVKRHNAP